MIKKFTGFKGKIKFNKKYPDGVKSRKIDSTIITKLGWKHQIKFSEGLKNYCNYYLTKIMYDES